MKLTVPKIDIRQRNTQLAIGAGAGLLVLLGLILVIITIIPRFEEQQVKTSELRAGETTLSKQEYEKMITQAKEQSIPESEAKSTIQEALYQQEAMRKLGITVPKYLIAAQKYTDDATPYVQYDQLSDYERSALYPKAVFVILSVIQSGGSIATVYHAPYSTTGDVESNRVYAEGIVNQVKQYKSNTASDDGNKQPGDPLRAILEVFTADPSTHIEGVQNYSRVAALTDANEEIISNDEVFLTTDKLPVTKRPFDTQIVGIVKDTKENTLSAPTKMNNAYVIVHKDKLYAKDDSIISRYQAALEGAGR